MQTFHVSIAKGQLSTMTVDELILMMVSSGVRHATQRT